MSWFYEALTRAEANSPHPDKSTVGTLEKDGDSFLNQIESFSQTATPTASIQPEGESDAAIRQMIPPAEPSPNSNGFRHLSVALREEARLVFCSDPMSMAAEQFRFLRRSLVQGYPQGARLLITSPGAGDGKTLTAINLCAALADGGDPTLLVELDLRRPSAHRVFGCKTEDHGIEDALIGRVSPEKTVHYLDPLGFYAAIVSKIPKEPSRLLTGPGIHNLLAWARPRFRWVLFDTAPVMPNADVTELLPRVDAALLIVRAQCTPKELSRRAVDVLGKRLQGVIFNEATIHSAPYYRYLDGYYQAGASKLD
jgi:Mrp family chromosome partitioning ATPase